MPAELSASLLLLLCLRSFFFTVDLERPRHIFLRLIFSFFTSFSFLPFLLWGSGDSFRTASSLWALGCSCARAALPGPMGGSLSAASVGDEPKWSARQVRSLEAGSVSAFDLIGKTMMEPS